MSEQTPAEGQPTPETTVDGEAPPPPPEKKSSRTPWIVGTAVVLVLLLVAGGIFAALTVFKKDNHSIAISKTAGGMKRDTAKEAQLKQQLDAAEQQFKTQFKNVSYVKSGIYNQDDSKRGPQGALVFLGAKVKKSDKNASTFVNTLRKQAGTNGFKVTSVSAGDGDAKAVCATVTSPQKVTVCGWATKDTVGELVPTVPDYDSKQLSKIMVDVRADVEQTE
jgi:hypothetical protein